MSAAEYWAPLSPDHRIYNVPEHGDFATTWCRGRPFAHPIRKNIEGVWEMNTLAYLPVESKVIYEKDDTSEFKLGKHLAGAADGT